MKKISSMEYNCLVWFLIRAGYIGVSISSLIAISGRDSWFSGLIALVLGLIPFAMFCYLQNYDSNKNICDLNVYLFGKFGKFINIVLALGVLFVAQIAFLDMTHFINSQFLYKTPIWVISIVFIIPVAYSLFKGINAVSRTSLLLFYVVIAVIIFIILGIFSGVELENLKPVFTTDGASIIHGSLILVAYNVLPLFFLLIIPKNKLTGYSSKKSLIFYFLAMISIVNAAFMTIGIFGLELSLLYEYPEFHLLKKVQIGNFIDRVESILSMEWILALFVLIMVAIYFVSRTFEQTFKVKEKTNNIFKIIICLFLLIVNQFIFTTNGSANDFFKDDMLVIMFTIFFFIPLCIIIACKLKHVHNKHGARNNNSSN